MNSFQQILLGLACVGGAFGLGHYLNNVPPHQDEIVTAQENDFFRAPIGSSLLEPHESGTVAILPNYRPPSKLNQEFEPIDLLPPPSQLMEPELATAAPSMQDGRHLSPLQTPITEEGDVEVPDFSALVAKFNQVTAIGEGRDLSKSPNIQLPNAGFRDLTNGSSLDKLGGTTDRQRFNNLPSSNYGLGKEIQPPELSSQESRERDAVVPGHGQSSQLVGINPVPSPHVSPSEIERRKVQLLDPTIDRYRLQLDQLDQSEKRPVHDKQGHRNNLVGQTSLLELNTIDNTGFNSEQFAPNLRSQNRVTSNDNEAQAVQTFSVLEPLPQRESENQHEDFQSLVGTTSLPNGAAEFAPAPPHLPSTDQRPNSLQRQTDQPSQLSQRSNRVRSYSDPFPPLPGETGNAVGERIDSELASAGQAPIDDLPLRLNIPIDRLSELDHSNPDSSLAEAYVSPPMPQEDPSFSNWRQNSARAIYPPATQANERWQLRDLPTNGESSNGLDGNRPVSMGNTTTPTGLTSLRQTMGNNLVQVTASRFQNYVTQAGDNLANISTRFFGKPDYYLDIYLVNQTVLPSPADVPVGVTLRIPIYE